MKTIKKFIVGSNSFFNDKFNDYAPKDIDELHIMDEWIIPEYNMVNEHDGNIDAFYCKNMTKEEFINDMLDENAPPMRIARFLAPEFIKYLNMTINDLKRLEQKRNEIDDKHKYLGIIYDSYIKNNDFYLTDKQLQHAYNEYKRYR